MTCSVSTIQALLYKSSPSLEHLHSMCSRRGHRVGTETFSLQENAEVPPNAGLLVQRLLPLFFDKLTKSYWLEICLPSHVTIASSFPLTSCPSSNKIMSKQFRTDNNRWDVCLLKPPWGNGVGCLNAISFHTHFVLNFHRMITINFVL